MIQVTKSGVLELLCDETAIPFIAVIMTYTNAITGESESWQLMNSFFGSGSVDLKCFQRNFYETNPGGAPSI